MASTIRYAVLFGLVLSGCATGQKTTEYSKDDLPQLKDIRPYMFEPPKSEEESYLLMQEYFNWQEIVENRLVHVPHEPNKPGVTDDCETSEDGKTVFVSMDISSKLYSKGCEIRAGQMILTNAGYLRIMGRPQACADNARKLHDDFRAAADRYQLFINSKPEPQGLFYNTSPRCMYLKDSSWNNTLTLQTEGEEGVEDLLGNHYANGYFTRIRFNQPGIYQLKLTQQSFMTSLSVKMKEELKSFTIYVR